MPSDRNGLIACRALVRCVRDVVTVLGMAAEMKRKFILARQRAGIEAAMARRIYAGVGRVKSVPKGRTIIKHYGQETEAVVAFLGLLRAKRRRGYRTLSARPTPAVCSRRPWDRTTTRRLDTHADRGDG